MSEKQALDGIKVVDFSWSAVGPLIAKHLADHGATVIHVESHTHPDPVRLMRPFKDNIPGIDRSAWFANYNSSKYGISLNLNKPRAPEIALKLVKWADVLVESYTPGTMKRWGLDYQSVRQVKPDIVYCSTTIFGQYGALSSYRGYGNLAAAFAGINHLSGWQDRPPVIPYGAYTDFTSPRFAVASILAALDYRRRTGKGQHIDQSQVEAGLQVLATTLMDYAINGRAANRDGNRLPYAAPHGAYRCLGDDRWCVIAVFTDEQWANLVKAMGEPPWTGDPKFATLLARKEHEDELDRLVEAWTSERTPEQVMAVLQSLGVPAGVVETAKDLFADPQLKHRNHFRWFEHSVIGRHAYDGPAFRLSRTPDRQSAAHCLGEHNEHVYKRILGMSDDEIAELLIGGVITTEADLLTG